MCARHGEPAVARKRVKFGSGVSPWSYLLVLLGVVGLVILAVLIGANRKRAVATAWPFCRRCLGRHATMLYSGAGLIVGGGALGVVSASISEEAISPGLLWGILILIAGAIMLAQSGWSVVAGGRVIDDGQTVEFRRAHDAFVAQAVAAQQAAAQHYAAQRAAYAAGPVPGGQQDAARDGVPSGAPQQACTSPSLTDPFAAADFPQPTPTASPEVLSMPAVDPPGVDQA
ncbi:hypothetical protein [Actinoplanes subtropicus]|uniref:hypothetical protein n=1 Tax=Actinoplanes subtropicus TaxID=543632 RepID=UPI000A826A67|nr:hypothetical protein [Actinoplanes subtropicus]